MTNHNTSNCVGSDYCSHSYGCINCVNCSFSLNCSECRNCSFIYNCINSIQCRFSSDLIFCFGLNYKEYYIFNKEVSKEVFWKCWDHPWRSTEKEYFNWVKSLPNFSKELYKKINGKDFPEETVSLSGKEVTVTLDGKTYTAVIK